MKEIERRYGSLGLHAYSINPGMISSGLQKQVTTDMMSEWSMCLDCCWKCSSYRNQALLRVWAGVAQVLKGKGDQYLQDCQVIGPLADNARPLD